jgi:hypothetical protein
MHFIHLLLISVSTIVSILVGAAVCHAMPRLGPGGKRVAEAFCRAPGLDVLITYFTILPMIVGMVSAGWLGLVFAIIGQVAAVQIWEVIHEAIHRDVVKGPRIVKVINAKVGTMRNFVATWITAIATPVFWFVRLAEIVVYPPLTWIVRLPAYNHAEWVNVSRQKFQGLVGHDLIWCLYCDWMTGIWSLGTEMLRNVESFWCPIRFASDKKCDNCSIDFPDVNNGWVDAKGTIADVASKLDAMYEKDADHPWFGHRVRLTVKGKEVG